MKFEDLPIGFRRDAGHKVRVEIESLEKDVLIKFIGPSKARGVVEAAHTAMMRISSGMVTGGYLDSFRYPDPQVLDVLRLLGDDIKRFTWDPGDDEDVACQVAMAEFVARCKHEPFDSVTELKRRAILPQIMAKFPRAKSSYIHCGICGHTPKRAEKPNLGPIRWYDPDDGHVFGTLCQACAYRSLDDQPKPNDFCVRADGSIPFVTRNTDEDITHLLPT